MTETISLNQKIEKLDEQVEWFYSDDFKLEEASDRYKELSKLAKEIVEAVKAGSYTLPQDSEVVLMEEDLQIFTESKIDINAINTHTSKQGIATLELSFLGGN